MTMFGFQKKKKTNVHREKKHVTLLVMIIKGYFLSLPQRN